MELQTLTEFIKKLCLYFERKIPSYETIEQWYPEVEHIPAEPLDWIAKQIKSHDTWPRNLPAAIKQNWFLWLDSNPNKVAKDKELGCHGCFQGYIQVAYFDDELGNWYNTMFRCAYCRPKHPQSMALSTIEELAAQGYHRPMDYLTSLKYANMLPEAKAKIIPIKRSDLKPLDDIVQDISDKLAYPET